MRRATFCLVVATVITLNLLPTWNIHVVPESWRRVFDFRYDWNRRTEYELWKEQKDSIQAEIGLILKQHFGPEDSIVVAAIGEIGYYSDLHVYDRNSLINRDTVDHWDKALSAPGHDKSVEPHWFLPLEPTIIKFDVIDGPPPERINPEYPLRRRIRSRAEELQRWGRRSGVHVWRRYVPQIFPMSPSPEGSEMTLLVLRLIKEEPHVKKLPQAERIAIRKERARKEWAKFYHLLESW